MALAQDFLRGLQAGVTGVPHSQRVREREAAELDLAKKKAELKKITGAASDLGLSAHANYYNAAYNAFKKGGVGGAVDALNNARRIVTQHGGNVEGLDDAMRLLTQNPEQAGQTLESMVNVFRDTGVLEAPDMTEKERLIAKLQDPNLSDTERTATEMALGLTAKKAAVKDPEAVAAEESAKLGAQFKFKPLIQKAVKQAEEEAANVGEALSDYKRAKSAMPGLLETISSLKALAPLATHTIGGKVWNATARELGFGATEGATARAKFQAIINNQVLPLLKPTFGGAFTAAEGDKLAATLGDADLSPEEKMAQLDAFIEQKMRDLEMKEGRAKSASSGQQFDTGVKTPSVEDLVNQYAN